MFRKTIQKFINKKSSSSLFEFGMMNILSKRQLLFPIQKNFFHSSTTPCFFQRNKISFWDGLFQNYDIDDNDDEYDDDDEVKEKRSEIVIPNKMKIIPVKYPYSRYITSHLYYGEDYEYERELIREMKQHKREGDVIGLFFSEPYRDFISDKDGINEMEMPRKVNDVSKVGVAGIVKDVLIQGFPRQAMVVFEPLELITIDDYGFNSLSSVKVKRFKSVYPHGRKEKETLDAYAFKLFEYLNEIKENDDVIVQHNVNEMMKEIKKDMQNSNYYFESLIDGALFTVLCFRKPKSEMLQDIVEEKSVIRRMERVVEEIKKELETLKIKQKIKNELDNKINESQRQYYLTEQYKIIGKELGLASNEKEVIKKKFSKLLEGKKLDEEVSTVIEEETTKLMSLDPHSAEFNVCRSYLEWLCVMPWGVIKEENKDIISAEEALNSEHYGLDDLKKRILEFIAVSILRDSVQGKILCFVGPAGTGKTSIGRSIAKALSRNFYRFSVGGMNDVSEIKGHRRTYVGSMPGRIIQILKRSESSNPVILIDEIDKIGKDSYRGDPSSALLEVLDPEQNINFVDHYLDVPIDLSNVLFICTANITDTIPPVLLDRMEVIRLSGYVLEEKLQIAKRYLFPRLSKETGISEKSVNISDPILIQLIKGYCREAGVRSLEKSIQKILRKIAYDIVKSGGDKKQYDVNETKLIEYLGKPLFISEKYFDNLNIGTTIGLAWNEYGGSIIYIETIPYKSDKPEIHYTGQLGDVMKESVQISYIFAKTFLQKFDPENKFFDENSIHLHCPEGGISKDGPSAGITIVTSLLSLALKEKVDNNLGMTGEMTLTGKILPIGGVKEKIVAARRSGLNKILLPQQNERDLEELSEELKEGIVFNFVDEYKDVFDIVFE